MLGLLLILSGFLHSTSFGASPCPEDAKAWSIWRANEVAKINDISSLGAFERTQLLNDCANMPGQEVIFQNKDFQACMQPLKDISAFSSGLRGHENSSRMTMSPEEYSKSSRVPYPGLLDPPPEFKNLKPGPPESIVAQLKEIKKTYPTMEVIQKNDGNYLVRFPGEDYSRFLNLNTRGGISFLYIGIQKTDSHHKRLNPPKSFFTRYHPDQGKEHFDMSNCISCHRTGAMPAVDHSDSDEPLRAVFPKEDAHVIAARFNADIEDTADAVPDSFNMRGMYPPMGDSMDRSDEFMKKCANKGAMTFTPKRLDAIRKGMDCAQCHNGDRAGVISAPIGMGSSLMHGLVSSGHMPPGSDDEKDPNFLEPAEREALYRCVLTEYYGGVDKITPEGTLIRTILEKPCPLSLPKDQMVNGGSEKKAIPKSGGAGTGGAKSDDATKGL